MLVSSSKNPPTVGQDSAGWGTIKRAAPPKPAAPGKPAPPAPAKATTPAAPAPPSEDTRSTRPLQPENTSNRAIARLTAHADRSFACPLVRHALYVQVDLEEAAAIAV